MYPCPRCDEVQSLKVSPGVVAQESCRHCNRPFTALIFEPPPPPVEVRRLGETGLEGENPCAHHEGNAAEAECDRCGAYICALCRIDCEARVLCPACFDRLVKAKELPSLETRFRDRCGMALSYCLFGILFWVLGIVLGPAAVYYAFTGLRELRRRGETHGIVRGYLAMLLGGLLTVGWFLIIGLMLFSALIGAMGG
ncbi:MAG: DUF4190 domain-containing protein [bacterium]|nr:DUF4190 domain-containing protein [bacterium]